MTQRCRPPPPQLGLPGRTEGRGAGCLHSDNMPNRGWGSHRGGGEEEEEEEEEEGSHRDRDVICTPHTLYNMN